MDHRTYTTDPAACRRAPTHSSIPPPCITTSGHRRVPRQTSPPTITTNSSCCSSTSRRSRTRCRPQWGAPRSQGSGRWPTWPPRTARIQAPAPRITTQSYRLRIPASMDTPASSPRPARFYRPSQQEFPTIHPTSARIYIVASTDQLQRIWVLPRRNSSNISAHSVPAWRPTMDRWA